VRSLLPILCLALGLGFFAGCTANPQAPAQISGAVTYKGNPLPAGTVIFHSAEQGSYRALLNADGTYEVRDVPTGKLVVTIETESVNPAKKPKEYAGGKGAKQYQERLAAEGRGAASKTPPQEYVKIPPRYTNREKSPLSIDAVAGTQVQNFTLTDD